MKKNREPRWDEDFQFPLDEPPINDKLHVEVISTSSRMGLIHPKVRDCMKIRSFEQARTKHFH